MQSLVLTSEEQLPFKTSETREMYNLLYCAVFMKHFLSFCLAFTPFLGLKCRFTYQELDPRDCLSLCKCVSMCRLYVCVFPVAHTVRFVSASACLLVLCVWLIVLASPRFPLASPSWTETKGQTSPCPRKEGLRETRQSGRRENR